MYKQAPGYTPDFLCGKCLLECSFMLRFIGLILSTIRLQDLLIWIEGWQLHSFIVSIFKKKCWYGNYIYIANVIVSMYMLDIKQNINSLWYFAMNVIKRDKLIILYRTFCEFILFCGCQFLWFEENNYLHRCVNSRILSYMYRV